MCYNLSDMTEGEDRLPEEVTGGLGPGDNLQGRSIVSTKEFEQLQADLVAETNRADRAEIEAIIMLEMACRVREISVACGFQIVATCQRYVEDVKPLLEDRFALQKEVERRLVEKRNRRQKREDGL